MEEAKFLRRWYCSKLFFATICYFLAKALQSFGYFFAILNLRKGVGLSQGELADKVDSTPITIGRYERDEVKPPLEVAARIAKVLGVSLDYLAGLTDSQVDATTLNKIIEIQSLNDEDRKHIMTMVGALLRDAKVRNAHR